MRRPGQWLRIAAARLCAKRTRDRVLDPIIADIQTEHEEAVRAGRWGRAAWVRINGYSAFWKAVGLHTLQSGARALWNCIAEAGCALGRTIACSLVAFVGFTLLLAAWPMAEFYSRFQNLELTLLLLPQAIALGIPVALPLGIVCGADGPRDSARRIRSVLLLAIVTTLLAFAATLIIPYANQAFRVALAEEFGLRGITKYSLPRGMNDMSLSELKRAEYDAGGFPERARAFRRAYHIRFAVPAATFVLSLLALGIGGILRNRARRVVVIVIALGVYWAALAVAESTRLPPAISVWAPNIMFTASSLALLKMRPSRLQQVL